MMHPDNIVLNNEGGTKGHLVCDSLTGNVQRYRDRGSSSGFLGLEGWGVWPGHRVVAKEHRLTF